MNTTTKVLSAIFISGLMLVISPVAKANPQVVVDPAPTKVVVEHRPTIALKANFSYVSNRTVNIPSLDFVIHNVSPFMVGQSDLSLQLRDSQGRVVTERTVSITNLPAGAAVKQSMFFPQVDLDKLVKQDLTITSLTLIDQTGKIYPGQEQNYIAITESNVVKTFKGEFGARQ